MREIRYMMHFRGRVSPVGNGTTPAIQTTLMRTTGSATSCVVSTVVESAGVQTELKASQGDLAFLESEFRVTGPESFEEDGMIAFGDANEHVLRFSTLGQGHLTTGLEPGTMAGTASWKVEGGEGQFAGARGFISSTFTISKSGDLSDFHCGLILIH